MAELSIYASVTIHDSREREDLLEWLNRFDGLVPIIHNDTVEWSYEGGRNTVIELADEAGKYTIHSIRVSAYSKHTKSPE